MVVESIVASQILAFVRSSRALNLTDEVLNKIKSEGLYHITHNNNIDKIMKGSIAQLIPSNVINSYSNYFQKSVFMFAGMPNGSDIVYNMKVNELHNYKVIHIPPEEVKRLLDNNKLKFRNFDNAIMYKGTLTAFAKLFDLKDIIKMTDLEKVSGMNTLQSILHRASKAVKTFGRMNILTYVNPVKQVLNKNLENNVTASPIAEPVENTRIKEIKRVGDKRDLGELHHDKDILKKVIDLYKDSYPAIEHICVKGAVAVDNINQEHGDPLPIQDIKKMYKEAGKRYEPDQSSEDLQEFNKFQKAVDGIIHAEIVQKQEQVRQEALQKGMMKSKTIEL